MVRQELPLPDPVTPFMSHFVAENRIGDWIMLRMS